jgi:hypothetical protein
MKKGLSIILASFLLTTLFSVVPTKSYAAECEMSAPSGNPVIFRINREGPNAILNITPAGMPYNEYVVAYGLKEGDEQYGATFKQDYSSGALRYVINNLDPNTTYYFKVRAGNNCQPGNWSKWLASKPQGSVLGASDDATNSAVVTLPVTGSVSPFALLFTVMPVILMIIGLAL